MSRGPRSVWLAGGALVAALVGTSTLLPHTSGDTTVPMVPWALPATALAAGVLGLVGLLVRLGRFRAAVLLLGLGSVGLRVALPVVLEPPGATPVAPLPNAREWHGQVLRLSTPLRSEQRAFLVLRPVPDTGERPGNDWTVYAWLPRHPVLVPGDRVAVAGRLEALPDEDSGFTDFLRGHAARATLRATRLDLLGPGEGPLPWIERLRWVLGEAVSRALPEPEAGLAAGLLVGLRSRMARELGDDFTTTGLSHVVAISGWHMALVVGVVTALLRAMGLAHRARSLVLVLAIVGYTLLAGAGPSVLRAAAMGLVALMAREGGRPAGARAALGLACWLLLLADPGIVWEVGFGLSVAATAGILVLADGAVGAVDRHTRGRAPRWISEVLGISLAAQVATLPLILAHFARLSLVSPLANLAVMPLVPPAMLGAFTGALRGLLPVGTPLDVLLTPLAVLAWLPLTAMVRISGWLAEIPLASLELPEPVAHGLAAAMALVLLRSVAGGHSGGTPDGSTAVERARRRLWAAGSRAPAASDGGARRSARARVATAATGAVLVAVVAFVVAQRAGAGLRVSVLDVGQGDAILLEGSRGARLLIDGGPDPDLLVRRLDELIPPWDRRIDMALLTHPHEDHVAGFASLAPRYRVGAFAESGMSGPGPSHPTMRQSAARLGIPLLRLARGDRLRLDDALVEIIWPMRGGVPETAPPSGRAVNDTSLVLVVTLERQRALLTGDLEEDRDADLVALLPGDGRPWDILKVAHHGSATATSALLLGSILPRIAIISSGLGNSYGHPAGATLERLERVGARVRRTDQHGTVSLVLDGQRRLPSGEAFHGLVPHARRLAQVAGGPAGGLAGGLAGGPAGGHRAARVATDRAKASSSGAAWRPSCYARADGCTDPHRGRSPAPFPVAFSPPAGTFDGRGGDLLFPGPAGRQPWGHARSPPGGDRQPAP